MINQNRKYAIMLFVASFVLAIVAIVVGTTFYPHEDGGPARVIGAVAFVLFITSLIFRQRATQAEKNKAVTSLKSYTSRIILVLVLLPFYLFLSYMALIMAGFGGNPIPLLFVILGFFGLLWIIFRK